jgi:hypothetical protein
VCKYVEIFTHHVGSIGAPSRTVFVGHAQNSENSRKLLGGNNKSNNNNNSVQLFIIYVLSQQLQGQLQTQHSADIHNYIMDTQQHKVESKLQEHIIAEKQTNKQAKMIRKDNYEQKTLGL